VPFDRRPLTTACPSAPSCPAPISTEAGAPCLASETWAYGAARECVHPTRAPRQERDEWGTKGRLRLG
jgi:hypothetical protein